MKKMTALFLSLLLVLTMTAALAETDITSLTFPSAIGAILKR
ncbi:MAG: hypothetical protein ACLUI3_06580 [Christensenellales bacterium]